MLANNFKPLTRSMHRLALCCLAITTALLLGACNSASESAGDVQARTAALQSVGLEEGRHYKLIEKPVFEVGDKFIVHEFFWYGCPHCKSFEPALHSWKKKLLGGVVVEQVPAVWAEPMELHARVFYLVESLPREKREDLHAELFEKIIALRKQRDIKVQEQELSALLEIHGVSSDQFAAALKDKDIAKKIERAKRLMQRSGASSTPTLMVNGRYLVLNDTARGPADITAIADKIIRAERKLQRNARAPG